MAVSSPRADSQKGRCGRRDPRREHCGGIRSSARQQKANALSPWNVWWNKFLTLPKRIQNMEEAPDTELPLMLTKSFEASPASSPSKWTKPRFDGLRLHLGMENPSPIQHLLHQRIFLVALAGVRDAQECLDCILNRLLLSALPGPQPSGPGARCQPETLLLSEGSSEGRSRVLCAMATSLQVCTHL